MSPHKLYFKRKPNLAHLRVFGSIAYVHVLNEKWRKLDAKAEKCILVSYSDEQKGYKYYNPRSKAVRVSRDVIFNESSSWYFSPPKPEPKLIVVDDPVEFGTVRSVVESEQPDSLISLWMSGPNPDWLSRSGQPDDEPTSSDMTNLRGRNEWRNEEDD